MNNGEIGTLEVTFCWAEVQLTQQIKEEEIEKRTQNFNVVQCLKTYSTILLDKLHYL